MARDFPGDSVTKNWDFKCKGRGFKHSVSGQGTKIPCAAKCSQKIEKTKKNKNWMEKETVFFILGYI